MKKLHYNERLLQVLRSAAVSWTRSVWSVGRSGNARGTHGVAVHSPTIHREDTPKVADGLKCGYEAVYHEDNATKDGPPEGLLHSHGLKDEPATTDLCDAS